MHSTMWKKGEGETFWILNLSAWVSLNERAYCRWWSLNNNKKITTTIFGMKQSYSVVSHERLSFHTILDTCILSVLTMVCCLPSFCRGTSVSHLLLRLREHSTTSAVALPRASHIYIFHSFLSLMMFPFCNQSSFFFVSFYHPFSFYPPLSFSLTHDLFAAEYHHFVSSIQTCSQQHKQSKFFLANNFPLWNR